MMRFSCILLILLFALPGCTASPVVAVQESPAPLSPTVAETATPTLTPVLPSPTGTPAPSATPATPTATATPALTATPVPATYQVEPGDTVLGIALAHGLSTAELLALNGLDEDDVLQVGMTLIVPSQISVQLPAAYLAHDSEVVYSPAYMLWDTKGFVEQQGGFLASFQENGRAGWQIIDAVAAKYHIGPRVLLAAMELASGWVTQPQPTSPYAFGVTDGRPELTAQASWAAVRMMEGYYGQLEGRRDWVVLSNAVPARMYPDTNPGSAAVLAWLAAVVRPPADLPTILQEQRFENTYRRLFGEVDGGAVRPPGGTQPELALPWTEGERWFFTGGAHGGYGDRESGWAALDFAPPVSSGCRPSSFAVRAVAPGLVIGSDRGETWIDMDGDGDIRTGWVIFYMHLATEGRIAAGERVQTGDVVGYPSCEGGRASGAHLHLARMYHGQWMPATRPVPFQLGEWTAGTSEVGSSYEGFLLDPVDYRITACDCRSERFNRFPDPEERRLRRSGR